MQYKYGGDNIIESYRVCEGHYSGRRVGFAKRVEYKYRVNLWVDQAGMSRETGNGFGQMK